MGNINDTIRSHIEREFVRVKRNKSRDFITVEEAKNLSSLEDMPINFTKLAVLFMLDMDKNGKVTLPDMHKFADWCAAVTRHVWEQSRADQQSFMSELQAQCALTMWKQVCLSASGKRAFADWFLRLFSVGMVVKVAHYPEITFLNTDTVSTLHEILSLQELYGINRQLLIDIMQRVGEEMGILKLDDEELDDVIPVKVVHMFAEHFIEGFLGMMSSLDFVPSKYLFNSSNTTSAPAPAPTPTDGADASAPAPADDDERQRNNGNKLAMPERDLRSSSSARHQREEAVVAAAAANGNSARHSHSPMHSHRMSSSRMVDKVDEESAFLLDSARLHNVDNDLIANNADGDDLFVDSNVHQRSSSSSSTEDDDDVSSVASSSLMSDEERTPGRGEHNVRPLVPQLSFGVEIGRTSSHTHEEKKKPLIPSLAL